MNYAHSILSKKLRNWVKLMRAMESYLEKKMDINQKKKVKFD